MIDPFDLPPALYVLTTLGGAAVVLTWRHREARTPVTVPKVIAPPLGMSSGLMMFLARETRIPITWALGAFTVGATLFAWPLLRTSKLTRVGGEILMQRSRAFLWILVALVAVRVALRAYIEQTVSTPQTGALFFLLALGGVVRWRVVMLREYLKLRALPAQVPAPVA
jgi:membrane protein CcdC involved in cytochrome C biogenesis